MELHVNRVENVGCPGDEALIPVCLQVSTFDGVDLFNRLDVRDINFLRAQADDRSWGLLY